MNINDLCSRIKLKNHPRVQQCKNQRLWSRRRCVCWGSGGGGEWLGDQNSRRAHSDFWEGVKQWQKARCAHKCESVEVLGATPSARATLVPTHAPSFCTCTESWSVTLAHGFCSQLQPAVSGQWETATLQTEQLINTICRIRNATRDNICTLVHIYYADNRLENISKMLLPKV